MVDGLGNDQQIPTPGDKPRRGRPPGSTKQTSGTSKKPAGKAKDAEQTKFMVQTLLSVAFNVTSMRAGEHWKLSTAEAEALAEPIAAIMERHDLTEKTGAYGEYIALIAAVGMIIVPKAMMHMDIQKKKGGIRLVQQPKQTTPPASGGTTATSNANASEDERSHQPVQQRDPVYRPSDVKRSLAWIGG